MSDEKPDESVGLSHDDFMPMSHVEQKSEPEPQQEEAKTKPPEGYVPLPALQESRQKYRELQAQFDELKKSIETRMEEKPKATPDPDDDEIQAFLKANSSDPEVKALARVLDMMGQMQDKMSYFENRFSESDIKSAESWHKTMIDSLKGRYPDIEVWKEEDKLNDFYRFAAENGLTSDKAFVTGFEGFFREAITQAEVQKALKKSGAGRKAALPKTGGAEAPATAFPYDDRVKRALERLKAAGH